MKTSYDTLSEAISGLRQEGYTLDFNLNKDCLTCHGGQTVLSPDEFEIDAVYRFEGESNPDDQAVAFAISSTRNGLKGILVNGYGVSADDMSSKMIEKLRQHHFPF